MPSGQLLWSWLIRSISIPQFRFTTLGVMHSKPLRGKDILFEHF